MSARYHALALLLAITLAYLWLQVPILKQYSFQIFSLFVAAFLIMKRFKKAKFWHIMPDMASLEITLITFAFLLLIGATGNTKSLFFPLGYIHLFFLVMASEVPTAIIATVAIMLFHYSVEPSLDITTIQSIITLPIMLAIFLFARKQYDEAHLNKAAAERSEQLRRQEHAAQQKTQTDPLLNSTIAQQPDQTPTNQA
jgi:K+-sensing histidine kinase KdpD